jgi:hypothetical protein
VTRGVSKKTGGNTKILLWYGQHPGPLGSASLLQKRGVGGMTYYLRRIGCTTRDSQAEETQNLSVKDTVMIEKVLSLFERCPED